MGRPGLETPATAVAAKNIFRYLMGAGSTAIVRPLINAIGIGWTRLINTLRYAIDLTTRES